MTVTLLSGVLPTRNRPDFVQRALRHHRGVFGGPLVVADGSLDEPYEQLRAIVKAEADPSKVTFFHRSADTGYVPRMAEALEHVTTPYVVLMADDDFYYEEWLAKAVRYLEEHPDTVAAWGHVLHFEIDGYAAYGEVGKFCFSVPNPVARWLADDRATDRLRSLGQGPWQTMGWYAVQRTEVLREIVAIAKRAELGPDMIERLVNLWQPLRGKLVMLDGICIARQLNRVVDETRPMSSFEQSSRGIERIEQLAIDALVETGVDRAEAASAVAACLAPEVAQLRDNDRFARTVRGRLRGRLMPLRKIVRFVRAMNNRRRGVDPVAPDPRFPKQPSLSDVKAEMAALAVACKGP